jgi:hypothetical protein
MRDRCVGAEARRIVAIGINRKLDDFYVGRIVGDQ